MTDVPRLTSPSLHQLYPCVDELLRHELRAALGIKYEITETRKALLKVIKLAQQARKEVLPVVTKTSGGKGDVDMEKYGVEESKEKIASENNKRCPRCGGEVEAHGGVYLCQQCGSAPFESGTEGRVGTDGGSDSEKSKT